MARWLERRWNLFATALALNIAAGCTYDYSAYSPVVIDTFGLTLRETDLVMNFAFFFYATTSYGYSICNQKLGPKRSPRIGCAVMLACYALLVYNLVQPLLPGPHGAALMSVLMGVGWAGQGTSLGAGFQQVVRCFPDSSGFAVGVIKGSLGAGGALAPAIFFGLWGQRPPENALGCWAAMWDCLLAATISSLLALFLGLSFLEDKDAELAESEGSTADAMHITVQQASKTAEYWKLGKIGHKRMCMLVFSSAAGSGQLVLTNLSQMADAIGFSAQSEALLCCFSFCNMLSRLAFGMACDILKRRRASRVLLFVLSTVLGACGQVLLHAAADLTLLVSGVVIVGLGFGGAFPTLVNVCAARWGSATLNANWTLLDAVGNGTASLLFGSYLGSYSYDRHADKSGRCFGRDCFSFPHLVMAAACVAGAMISIALICLHPHHRQIRRSLSQLPVERAPISSFDIDASS
eukprot:g16985.t1